MCPPRNKDDDRFKTTRPIRPISLHAAEFEGPPTLDDMAPPPAEPAKGRVLVVGDSPSDCDDLATGLRELGYSVRVSFSAAHAADRLQLWQPEVALIAATVGDHSGTELIPHAEQFSPFTQIVMVTYGADSDLPGEFSEHIRDVLELPVDPELLRHVVLGCMSTAKLARERSMVGAELRASEAMLRSVLRSVPEAIVTIGSSGLIHSFNTAAEQIFGYGAAEVLGRPLSILMSAEAGKRHSEYVERYDGSKDESFLAMNTREISALTKDGEDLPLDIAVSVVEAESERLFIGVMRDARPRKEFEDRLTHAATHDSLTGLPNRILLVDRIRQALAFSERHGKQLALLFIDLDGFKAINDTHGHGAGDAVLIEVARRLEAELRASDAAGRLGGDEFVVAAAISGPEDAARIGARIHRRLGAPLEWNGERLQVGSSVGVAIGPIDARDPEELLKRADAAMYAAKSAGKDQVRFFTAQMNAERERRELLERELARAIVEDELFLVYQPIYDIEQRGITRVEALVRWQHPTRGVVLPLDFIAVAESSDLILDIGRWVIERAVAQHRSWHREGLGKLDISVNISPRQVARGQVSELISTLARDTDLSFLSFEITENVLLDNSEAVRAELAALRDRGHQIALDDFGTGHSSLSYLREFPLTSLKIDRIFLREVPDHDEHRALLAAILALGEALELNVVAAGVESEEQLRFLGRLGCRFAQGYHLSPPVSADGIRSLWLPPLTHTG